VFLCVACRVVHVYMLMTGRNREHIGFTAAGLRELQAAIKDLAEAFDQYKVATGGGVNLRTFKWHRLSEVCQTILRLGCLAELTTAEFETAHTETKRAYRSAGTCHPEVLPCQSLQHFEQYFKELSRICQGHKVSVL